MSPRQYVVNERRRQITKAALACFTRQGYNNTTMDEIAAESGLSKGSLYWHFQNKENLFVAAVQAVIDDWGRQLGEAMARCESAADKLRLFADQSARFGRQAQGLFMILVEYWSQQKRDGSASTFWAEMLAVYRHEIAAIIQEGIESGEFRAVDAGQLTWALLAAYDGLAAYTMLIPDLDVERVSQVFVHALLDGLHSG